MFNLVSWAVWLNKPWAINSALWLQSPNKLDSKGVAPIHYAAQRGDLESMKTLLDKGSDINIRDINGNNITHYLVKGGMVNEFNNAFIDSKGADLNAVNNMGQTPLMIAVKQGEHRYCIKDCKVVFQNDINARDVNGKTALHYLVNNDSSVQSADKIFWMDGLINLDADVNIADNNGMTPLHYTAKQGSKECMELISKSYFEKCKLIPKTAKQKMAEFFNAKDAGGKTALHYAVENKSVDVINYLASKKSFIDFKVADDHQQNIVHYAAKAGDLDVFKLVKDLDLTLLNKLNAEGDMPLHIAIQNKKPGVASIILTENKGSFVNWINAEKQTPLHIACKNGDEYSVKVLLKHNANVNCLDADGNTPLLIAVATGNANVIDALLEAKADLSIRDANGNSSLLIACQQKDVTTVKKLLALGANPNDKNSNGDRTFDFAKDHSTLKSELIKAGGIESINLAMQDHNYSKAMGGSLEVKYEDGIPTLEFQEEQQSYMSWVTSWFY
jgi:ankyrin repeat protein